MASHVLEPGQGGPSVEPGGAPGGDLEHIQTDAGMFGGAVAQAEKGFGQTVEKVGEEGENYALNQAHFANQATTNKIITGASDDLLSNSKSFRGSMFGQDAVNGLAAANKNVDDTVDNWIKTSPNQYVSQESAAYLRRVALREKEINASHADAENKKFMADQASGAAASDHKLATNMVVGLHNLTPDHAQALDETLDHSDQRIFDYLHGQGLTGTDDGKKYVEQKVRENRGQGVTSLVQQVAMGDGTTANPPNAAAAKEILDRYRDKMDPDSVNKLTNYLSDRLASQTGVAAAGEAIRKSATPSPTALASGDDAMPHYKAAIASIESGGNYSAIGPVTKTGDQAFGKYQVMGNNVPEWTQQALGHSMTPQEFLHNPDAQEKVFEYKFGSFIKAGYSPGDAASIWFTGKPAAEGASRQDVTGTTGAQYVQKFNSAVGPSSTKASAYRLVMDDSGLTEDAKKYALQEINRQFTTAQVAAEADNKAKKEAIETTAGDYMTRIGNGDFGKNGDIVTQINNDPALHDDWRTREALMKIAQEKSGQENTAGMGSAYSDAFHSVIAPPGTPGRIVDSSTLLQLVENGSLTMAGYSRLNTIRGQVARDPDQQGVATVRSSMLTYAKDKLSFDQEMLFPGMNPLKDQKGRDIYNSKFVPMFESAYDNWIKQGKNPFEFLTKENVDKMASQLRSPAAMAMDRIAAGAEVGEGAKTPIPPAPPNIDPPSWSAVIQSAPPQPNGKPFTTGAWAHAVKNLVDAPTQDNIKAFDGSQFGKSGKIDGKTILDRLGVKVSG